MMTIVYELEIKNRKQFCTNPMQARAEQLSACSDELYHLEGFSAEEDEVEYSQYAAEERAKELTLEYEGFFAEDRPIKQIGVEESCIADTFPISYADMVSRAEELQYDVDFYTENIVIDSVEEEFCLEIAEQRAQECFLQDLFGKKCRTFWRILHLQIGENCRDTDRSFFTDRRPVQA